MSIVFCSQVAPNLVRYGNIEPANFFVQSLNLANEMSQQLSGKPLDVSVKVTNQLPQSLFSTTYVAFQVLENFYQTDPISRASPTMAKCVTAVKAQRQSAYAAS